MSLKFKSRQMTLLVKTIAEIEKFKLSGSKYFKMSQSLICDDKKEINLTEKLSEDLSNLFLSESYSDVTFLVENERIPSECANLDRNKLKRRNFAPDLIRLTILNRCRSQGYIGCAKRILPGSFIRRIEREQPERCLAESPQRSLQNYLKIHLQRQNKFENNAHAANERHPRHPWPRQSLWLHRAQGRNLQLSQERAPAEQRLQYS
jgi:hypothetical protein